MRTSQQRLMSASSGHTLEWEVVITEPLPIRARLFGFTSQPALCFTDLNQTGQWLFTDRATTLGASIRSTFAGAHTRRTPPIDFGTELQLSVRSVGLLCWTRLLFEKFETGMPKAGCRNNGWLMSLELLRRPFQPSFVA